MYNITGIATNTTSTLAFMQAVNQGVMDGWMFTMFLIGIGVVLFVTFLITSGDVKKAMSGTSIILMTFSMMLRAMDLVPNITLFITLVGAAIAIAFTWRED